MWGLHSANDDHWVPLATVTSFKRMKEFQTFGQDWIVAAIRKLSTFLEVDESGSNVRRTTEVQEPKGQHERSVYAVSPFSTKSLPIIRTYTLAGVNLIPLLERLRSGGTWAPAKARSLLLQVRERKRSPHASD